MTNTPFEKMPKLDDANWRVWDVVKNGITYARLEDARWVDMYWVAYRVRPTQEGASLDNAFWLDETIRFRHAGTGAVKNGIVGVVMADPVHVIIRALTPPPRNLFDAVRQRAARLVYWLLTVGRFQCAL